MTNLRRGRAFPRLLPPASHGRQVWVTGWRVALDPPLILAKAVLVVPKPVLLIAFSRLDRIDRIDVGGRSCRSLVFLSCLSELVPCDSTRFAPPPPQTTITTTDRLSLAVGWCGRKRSPKSRQLEGGSKRRTLMPAPTRHRSSERGEILLLI